MKTNSRIYTKTTFVCALLLFSVTSKAEYTDSCAHYANMLGSAANYYESEKSRYKLACDPYFGFSKESEGSCGPFGFNRIPYESAKSDLESALRNVSMYCVNWDQLENTMMGASEEQVKNLNTEISRLKDKIKKLEAENKALNNIIKPTQ